jgi:hypothetical protein
MTDIVSESGGTQPASGEEAREADTDTARQRLSQQIGAVRRRSRVIKSLRRWLPAAIVATFVLNVGWITVQSLLNSFNVYQANVDEIRMTNPRYVGQTGSGQPYTISGLEAVRRGKDATTIELKAPNIEIKGNAERPTRVLADKGVFDQTTQKFTFSGHVEMRAGGSDFVLVTEEAIVDLASSVIYGDKHVEAKGSLGHIAGESFVVRDEGKTLAIRGRGEAKVTANFNEAEEE